MRATFFQKVMLTVIAGFFAACVVEFYMKIIVEGDRSVNGGFNNPHGISSDH